MISQLADGLDQFFINIDKARVFSLALVVDMLSAFTGDSLKNVGTSELQRNHHFRLKLNSIEFPEELIEINPSQKCDKISIVRTYNGSNTIATCFAFCCTMTASWPSQATQTAESTGSMPPVENEFSHKYGCCRHNQHTILLDDTVF
ncbi:unnamed protein product [Albugo candida]|uniref:Uncharacterized protein n=1 Tax=Albugo candida TaxID=65357 RepID=A0A024GPJ5_9STRA|nr:unnamed protein product [Albugo candida]|eukprot:CCI48422.1 unnamed protein product [Albugo candida]